VLPRWLARVVLGAVATLVAVGGVLGVGQLLEPSPKTQEELFETIESAGFDCSSPAPAEGTYPAVWCEGGSEAIQVICIPASPSLRMSGACIPLKSGYSELSGDSFEIVGTHQDLRRLQEELGGQLQEMDDFDQPGADRTRAAAAGAGPPHGLWA
jgi:hypothetical protein